MADLKTVKPSGGDYTSLQAAVTAWAAANADWDIECYDLGTDDNVVSIPAGETTALRIYTPAAQRHDGISGTSGYRIGSDNFAHAITVNSPNVTIEGIRFVDGGDGNPNGAILLNAAVSWNVVVRECIDENTGSFGFLNVGNGTGGTVKVSNCIKVGGTSDPSMVNAEGGSGYTVYAYNCTGRSSYTGGFGFFYNRQVGTMVCKNCIGTFVTASTNTCFLGTITQDHNVSSDSTATGTGSKTGQTPSYVNAGSGDLHLQSGDTVAKDSGGDLSGDANYPITIDIDGQTRTGTWDIGADEVITSTSEQEGFRFGSDDGNEASYSFLASQDTNITAALNTNVLLRALINVTSGDPSSTAYTLRAQKNGSGGYTAVPIGAVSTPTLTFGAAGTTGISASGGSTVDPAYPTGITSTSALVLVVGQKPSSANGGTVTTPTGWTLQASKTGANDGDTGGYTTTLGADTGNCNIFVYTKDTVSGSESGTLTVTVGTNNVCWASIIRVQASDIGTWSYAATVGKDTAGGNVSITGDAGIAIAAGDHVVFGMVIPTDVTTPAQFSSEAVTQSGTTFDTVGEFIEPDSALGNDIGGWAAQASVLSGSGSAAPVWTATAGGTTTNVRGPGFIIRLRCSAITNEVYVSTSSNIAAGGEATTARLTAPSGKTTSDFVTGRRWDNENGTDSIDITSLDYTEVEWCLQAQSPAVATDFFDFRVYGGTSVLDTYTVTPRWTIASGAPTTVSAAWSGVASAVLALAGYQFSAGTLSIVTAASITGAGVAALSWQVPTTASAGTSVHIIVFSGSSPTYTILTQGTATVASNGIATIPASGSPGDKAFALVHNYDDDEDTTSIFGGVGIATVS